MTDLGPEPRYHPPALSSAEAEALARAHALREVGVRPRMGGYVVDVWRYRHLAWEMAKGEFVADHQDNHLGLLWAVINPLLLAGAYYLIFGLLVGTRGNIENFVAFLTIGLFVFTPLAGALTSGSRSLLGRMNVMRSLTFPRVLLPVTVTLAYFLAAGPAFVVLLGIALVSGERPTLSWLLYPVALVLVTLMGTGLAMMGSRIVHAFRDAANLLPLLTRLLRYVSGIFFSIDDSLRRFDDPSPVIQTVLEYQPVAVVMTMVRQSLMAEFPLEWRTWVASGIWALAALLLGFFIFWRGEGTYGRA